MSDNLHFEFTASDRGAQQAFKNLKDRLKKLDATAKKTNHTLSGIDVKMQQLVDAMVKVEAPVNRTSSALAKLERRFNGVGRSAFEGVMVLGMLEGAMSSLQHVFWTWQDAILRATDDIERLTLTMRGLATTGDVVKESVRDVNYVLEMTKSAPFKIDALRNSFVKFKSGGIDPTNGSLKALVDGVAAFGGSDLELERAAVAIQQMAGKGVISMEELRQQLGESVPAAMKLMARSMGVSVGQLVKQIETGTVAALPAIKGLLAEFELAFGGSAEKMMKTYSGQMSKLAANLKLLGREIGEGSGDKEGNLPSYYDAVTHSVLELNAALETKAFREWAQEFGTWLAQMVVKMTELMKVMYENRDAISAVATAIGYLVGGKLILGIGKLLVAPFVKLLSVLSKAGKGVESFADKFKNFNKVSADGGALTKVMEKLSSVGKRVTAVFGNFRKGMVGVRALFTTLRTGIAAVQPHFAALATAVWMAYEALSALYGIWDKSTLADRSIEWAAELKADPKQANESTIKDVEARLERLGALSKEATDEELERIKLAQKELQEALDKSASYVYESSISKELAQERAKIAEEMEAVRTTYNQESDKLAKAYEEIINSKMLVSEKEAALAKNRAEQRSLARGVVQKEMALLQREIDASSERLSYLSNPDVTAKERAEIEKRIEQMNQYQSQYEGLMKSLADVDKRYSGEVGKILSDSGRAALDKTTGKMKTYLKTLQVQFARMDGRETGSGAFLGAALERIQQFREELGEIAKEPAFEKLAQDIRGVARAMDNLERRQATAEKAGKLSKSADSWMRSDMDVQGPTKLDEFNTQFDLTKQKYEEILALANSPDGGLIPKEQVDNAKTMLQYMEANKQAIQDQIVLSDNITPFLNNIDNRLKKRGDYKNEASRSARLAAFDEIVVAENQALDKLYLDDKLSWEAYQGEKTRIAAAASHERQKLTEGAFAKLAVQYQDFGEQLENVMAGALEGIVDATTSFMMTGEDQWRNFAEKVIQQILRIALMKTVISPLTDGISNWFTSLQGGGATAGVQAASDVAASSVGSMAGGAIASVGGNLAMAGRSIAPQMVTAMPQQASMTRSAPAPASMGGAVEFNLINQSGEQMSARETGRRFDGKKMILDVVLEAVNKPGSFRDGMKGALS